MVWNFEVEEDDDDAEEVDEEENEMFNEIFERDRQLRETVSSLIDKFDVDERLQIMKLLIESVI